MLHYSDLRSRIADGATMAEAIESKISEITIVDLYDVSKIMKAAECIRREEWGCDYAAVRRVLIDNVDNIDLSGVVFDGIIERKSDIMDAEAFLEDCLDDCVINYYEYTLYKAYIVKTLL